MLRNPKSGLARAAQLEQTEHDSVVSAPLLDRVFLHEGEDLEGADPFSARVGMVALKVSLTVTSSRRLVRTISLDLEEHEPVVFDFSAATYIDDSAAMLVKQLIDVATEEGTPAIVMGVSGHVADTLAALDVLRGVPGERIVEDIAGARLATRGLLGLDPSPAATARASD